MCEKNQMELLEMKNTVFKMKILLDRLYSRSDTTEESVRLKTEMEAIHVKYREGGKIK